LAKMEPAQRAAIEAQAQHTLEHINTL
jgi:hypothetical protein